MRYGTTITGSRLTKVSRSTLALVAWFGLAMGEAGADESDGGFYQRQATNLASRERGADGSGSGIQSVHMSGQLETLSQNMITRSLLAALSIEKDANVKALKRERESFVDIITGLRRGDRAQGVQKATNAEILSKLSKLEKEWQIFGPVIQRIVTSGKVTPKDVAIVAECIEPIAEATKDLIDVAEYFATGGQTFSVLTTMVKTTQAQHARIKEMAAGYLLVAYGHQAEVYRIKLWAHYVQFDQVMKGLVEGDRRRRLLAAPSFELQKRFQNARQLWQQLSPTLRAVAEGGEVDRGSIPEVVAASEHLANELSSAVDLYKGM